MGYVKNHLATLVCGVFASVLTGLYFLMPADLWFIFAMAIPTMWFLVFICWIAQKAADYNHGPAHDEKKNHELTQQEINTYRINLKDELKEINDDDENERLRKEIVSLKTRVEIESIRAEIYNLKLLASQK
mgnify:FL=1|jgi:hypothetical protein|uniref:Uncharacterized protein n=1 Tax=uncultured marine thaumarchaeote KM3_46_F12 TaxID=1456160 RepID=A0A075H9X0_9ARCH|nr:hypothetical protein [uncultured marine thaumarchaeote KM3_46_F12]|tara:strand:+ start:315 stop:707 length:393 start_codon:yes stop_codon:yes gene_type:complete